MARLVEVRGIQPIEIQRADPFKIPKELIDGYRHVNHSGYIILFEEERHVLKLEKGFRVSQISITYDEQFRNGDRAAIETHVLERNEGLVIVGQEMSKSGSDRRVRQATRLVPEGTFEPVPQDFSSFNPKNHPVIADIVSRIRLPRPNSTDYHTVYAPIFESERAKVIAEKDMTVKQLAQEFGIMTVVVYLDAYYGGHGMYREAVTALTRGHLDMRSLRGGYASMIFQQAVVDYNNSPLALQQTRYLFTNLDGTRVNLPPEAEVLLTNKR